MTAIDVSADALALAARERRAARASTTASSSSQHDLADGLPGGPVRPRRLEPAVRRARTSSTRLQPEVRDWEPREALVGDGVTRARSPRRARDVLRPGGALVLEVGDGHGAARRRRCSRSSASPTSRPRRTSPGATASSKADGRRRRAPSRRSAPASRSSCRPTRSTGSAPTPYRRQPCRAALRAQGPAGRRSRPRSSRPTSTRCSSACPSCAAAPAIVARAPARARTRSSSPNPARRYPLARGRRPETIGVRVPGCPGRRGAVLAQVGAVAATSANLHGGPDPRRLDDVPEEIRAGVRRARRRRRAAGHRRRRCSTSPAPSRASCARAPCRPPRRSRGVAAARLAPPCSTIRTDRMRRWPSRRHRSTQLRAAGLADVDPEIADAARRASSSASAARSS